MAIQFKCPACGQTLRMGDEFAGKKARCQTCQRVVVVPGPQPTLHQRMQPEEPTTGEPVSAQPAVPPSLLPGDTVVERRSVTWIWKAAGVAAIAALLVALFVTRLKPADTTAPAPGASASDKSPAVEPAAANPWEVTLARGKVEFRTERFEPGPGRRHPEKGSDIGGRDSRLSRPDYVDLTFTIRNQSDQSVALSSLRVARLGLALIYEDLGRRSIALGHATIRHLIVEPGSLESALVVDGRPATCRDADLVANVTDKSIKPHTQRSFRVRLWAAFDQRVGIAKHPLARLDLSEVERRPPDLVAAAHLFAVVGEVSGTGGDERRLYSDCIYALLPDLFEPAPNPDEPRNRAIEHSYALPPAAFTERLIAWAVRTHRETLAYRVAKESKQVPPGFEPDAVSPYCYAGDPESPLRAGRPMAKYGEEILRQARSNVVSVLQSLRQDHAALWPLIEAEIERLASGPETVMRRKARFVRTQLMRRVQTTRANGTNVRVGIRSRGDAVTDVRRISVESPWPG